MTILGRDPSVQSNANTVFGMLVVAFGTGIFCTAGAIAQYNGGSILQLRLGSYAIQNVMCWAWWCVRKPSQSTHWFGDSPHRLNIWVRGILFWILLFAWLKGLEMVPIGDAEALIFLSPILTVVVGRVFLKEALPKLYPLTLVMTLVALLFICQPSFIFGLTGDNASYTQVNWPGLVFVLITCIAWSGVSILVRMGKEAHWLQVNLVTSFQCAWIWTPLAAILNHYFGNNLGNGNGTPLTNSDYSNVAWIDGYDFNDWDWSTSTVITICAMAFFEFFAVLCKVVGYQFGEATKVASMEYLDIVFAYAFQYWMFHSAPNKWELIGAGILIVSCGIQLTEEKFFPKISNQNEQSSGDKKSNFKENEKEIDMNHENIALLTDDDSQYDSNKHNINANLIVDSNITKRKRYGSEQTMIL